jgi:secreted PhoX family phosphatase
MSGRLKHCISRRDFVRASTALGVQAVVGTSLFTLGCDVSHFGPLGPPDENGIRLPAGFHSRVLAISGEPVGDTGHVWHGAPDGGAVFPLNSGWVYVSNSERSSRLGGVGALRFDPAGRVVAAYSICSGTRRNCAGGATPWGTWLSCEEVSTGLVFECDPSGVSPQIVRPALGQFNHEGVAADPDDQRLYLTEDRADGRLYRFTPNSWGNLDGGVLEVAQVVDGDRVRWHGVPDPNPRPGGTPTRRQVPISTRFLGGEGIVYDDGHVYFVTKFDNRVWDLDVGSQRIAVLYHKATDPLAQLSGVDNVALTPTGDLIVAEDGGNMELVMLDASGLALALLRVVGQPFSELAGPAFDPRGGRLYFSSQRGTDGRGITYEVRGPFFSRRRHALASARNR